MVTSEPVVDPRGLYGLVETAKILGVANSTVTKASNHPDKHRRLQFSIRRSTGRKVFRGEDIIRYWRLME